MKPSDLRMAGKLERRLLPASARERPDMTGWTSLERTKWRIMNGELIEMIREIDANPRPYVPEEADAREAEDARILAERAAKAAAEALARDPTDATAQQAVLDTREAADKAAQAAEKAQRIAEEAARRPRPQEPTVEPQAMAETPAPAPATPVAEPKPKRPRIRREPGTPKRQKQWWEERAKWQLRGPHDDDEHRGRPLNECIHEYDPLTYDDEDWEP